MKTEMTLRQMEIFCTVARARSLTEAAKQLGVAQPSISQQIAKLETVAGVALVERGQGGFRLTEAGEYLLRKAETVIAGADEAAAGLTAFREGRRATVAIAALNSVARLVLPGALAALAPRWPDIEVDLHEAAPAEALDMLYSRRVTIAVMAAASAADKAASLPQSPVLEDEVALAVPAWLDLDRVADPDRDLAPEAARVVNSVVQFNFGTRHNDDVAAWCRAALPRHRVIARTRSYETALAMVEAGLGVALAPALSALGWGGRSAAVRLYRTGLPPRRLVALTPTQYLGIEPYRSVLAALRQGAEPLTPPPLREAPFLRAAAPQAATAGAAAC